MSARYDATARRRWYRAVLRALRDGLTAKAALAAADYAISLGELVVGRGGDA